MNKQVAWWRIGLAIGILAGLGLAALAAALATADDPRMSGVPSDAGYLEAALIRGNP